MGEPEPMVVEQLDMGTQAVNPAEVVIPAEEHIIGFGIELTRSDRKWCRFTITTEHRTLAVEPGSIGQAQFDTFCGNVKAMFTTAAGSTVLNKLKAALSAKPLQVKTVVEEAPE